MRPLLLLAPLALLALGCGGGNDNPVIQQNQNNTMVVPADWSRTAVEHREHVGMRITYHCPPGGQAHTVWGSGTYTDDSSICTAAVHAGRISFGSGGNVTIEMRPGQSSYSGSNSNSVTSLDYPAWGGSFVFTGQAVY